MIRLASAGTLLFQALLTASLALAAPLGIVRLENGELMLQDTSCERVRIQLEALRTWTSSLDEKVGRMPALTEEKAGACSASIQSSVPEFVRDHHGRHSPNDGPNCWDAALVLSGLVPGIRYASQTEMNFWMTSPLCKKVAAGQSPQPGDIGAIRQTRPGSQHTQSDEVHGFIYLTPSLAFSKNGYSKHSPFSLQPLANVLEVYKVKNPALCNNSGQNAGKCNRWVEYFRCESPADYVRAHPKLHSDRYAISEDELSELECQLATVAGGKPSNLYRDLKSFDVALSGLKTFILNETSKQPLSDDDRVLWKSFSVRLDSLREQLRQLQKR